MKFERLLEMMGLDTPVGMKDSLIYVHDTLEGAKSIGESVFGEKVSAETVLGIYDRLVAEQKKKEAIRDAELRENLKDE
jgi:benzoyl-CoA reductase/2-hydroxyglutaryl-CoA dehydratase subunit BcrC/BadD/HgdB